MPPHAFRAISPPSTGITAPVLVDLRNIYNPAELRAKGFAYSSVGRV